MAKLLAPMRARDPDEPHRAATPLELFFDLTVVVAVSFAVTGLADQLEHGHGFGAVGNFAVAFFAVTLGWLNFTWFASAYDSDDWLYRVVTLVQMGGALTVAAGIPDLLSDHHYGTLVAGYVIMRVALGFQWLRAAYGNPARRVTALRYAAGIWILQVLWLLRLLVPSEGVGSALLVLLLLGELAMPVLVERQARMPYHPHHLVERYGLFTLIVLGEGVLAAANAMIAALQVGRHVASLIVIAVCSLIVLSTMWWFYFAGAAGDDVERPPSRLFVWGYGHFAIFAGAAAVPAGLELQIDRVSSHVQAGRLTIGLALGVPIAAFLVVTWLLCIRERLTGSMNVVVPVIATLTLLAGLLPGTGLSVVIAEAALLTLLIALLVISTRELQESSGSSGR